MEKTPFDEILGTIYLLYYKAKMDLGEAHLARSPKGYLQKFGVEMPFRCDLDILDYLIGHRSSIYSAMSRKSWILYVLEITKILSYNEAFGIGKLYNKILNKNININVSLDCFKPILTLLESKDTSCPLHKLKILRDKYYAHTDAEVGRLTDRLFPTYDEAWDLMFLIEQFLRDIYAQRDTDIDLDIHRHLHSYLREFKRTYQYFKKIEDAAEKFILRRHFDEEKCHQYFNSLE